uniref:Uncharacterized protein n=1 Tax=Callithrix jacchus TaxID=9483 RepID=A0A8I3W6K1_CALJA
MALPVPAGSVFLLVLYHLSFLRPDLSLANPQYVWRFFLTENYTKNTGICETPPYSHNRLLTTTDCPATGCTFPIQLNFSAFNNVHSTHPLLCFNYKQPGQCKVSTWHSCMGCVWKSCKYDSTFNEGEQKNHFPSLIEKTTKFDSEGNPTTETQFTLTIPDPRDQRWLSPQKASVYETNTDSYPSSHLYIWRAYVLTSPEIHNTIQIQETTLKTKLAPFSWLTLMREGLKLANQTGLTDLISCLLCATLGQTPLVAVPTMFSANQTTETSQCPPPIPDVPLFYFDTSSFPMCYSLQNLDPTCNKTLQLSTNLTAPHGFYFWCNGTLSKLLTLSDLKEHSRCLPVTLVPRLTVYSPAEFLMKHTTTTHTYSSPHRQRRAVFLPIVIGLSLAGSAAAIGLGTGALVNNNQAITRLSLQLQAAIDDSAASLASLQRQVTSVAQVALQNRRALDLLTAGQGGTCIFLQEECCYYINESGTVETRIEKLQKIKTELQSHQFTTEATTWWSSSMYSLLSPLVAPLIIICLFLLIAPCFFQFLQRRFQELTQVTINQMMLQPVLSHPNYTYHPLPTSQTP